MKSGPGLFLLPVLLVLVALPSAAREAEKDEDVEIEEDPGQAAPPPAALAFAIDPHDPAVLYASFTGRGLHKSLDGGETWLQEGEGVRSTTISAIATDPNRPQLVYVGGDQGLDRSLDGARTFAGVPEVPANVAVVRIDPRTSVLYVAGREGGLLRSDDGAAFVDLGPALAQALKSDRADAEAPPPRLTAFELDPSAARLLAAAGPTVLESRDRGLAWRLLGRLDAAVRDLVVDPAAPGRLFAATKSGVMRSLDGGRRWELSTLEEDVTSLAVAPPALFAVAASGIYRSLDAGETWERLLENPAEVVVVDRLNPGRIFAASYGQVWRTFDQGASWRGYRFPFTGSKPEVFAGRKQEPPPIPLLLRKGEDGDHVTAIVFDPDAPEIVYAAARKGVWKSRNGGRDWRHASVGLQLTDVHALVIDPREPSTLYAGTHGAGVFKSMDGAASWVEARRGLTDLVVRSLTVEESLPSTIYAATRRGLFASTDAGASWTELEAVDRPDSLTYVDDVRAMAFDARYGLQVTAATELGTFYAGDAIAGIATFTPGRLTIDARRAQAGCRLAAGGGRRCLSRHGIDPEALVLRDLAFLPGSTSAVAATVYGLWSGQAAPRGGDWTRLGLSANVSAILAEDEDLWAATANGLWRSSNEGFSWTRTPVAGPAYSVAVEPRGEAVFVGLDGAVYRHPLRFEAEQRSATSFLPPLRPPRAEKRPHEGRRIRVPEEVTPAARQLWSRIRKTPPHQMRLLVLLAAELAGRGPAEHTEVLRKLLISLLKQLYERHDAIREAGFSPDSRWLQTSFLLDDGERMHSELRLYELDTAPTSPEGLRPELLHWVELHDLAAEPEHLRPRWVLPDAGPVLAWSGDGRYVATHTGLGRVRVSSLAPLAGEVSPPPRTPAAHHFELDVPAVVSAAAVAADGRSFAVAGRRGVHAVVRLAWVQAAKVRVETFVLEGTEAEPAGFTHLVFIPRRRLLLFDHEGVVRSWRGTGEPVEFHRASDVFNTVELTPNLRWLVGSTEDELLLWRINGTKILPPAVVTGQPRGHLFSPGGAWLLLRDGGRIRLFDLRDGRLGPSVVQTEDVGRSLFSRGGESLLVRDGDVVTVYDLTKEPIRPRFVGAGSPFGWDRSETVSRDRRWTVTASGVDVDLWDLGEVRRRGARLRAGRFGPVGIHGDLSDAVRTRPLPALPEDGLDKLSLVALRNFACEVVGRSLSVEEWAAYLGDEPYQKTCVFKEKKGVVQRPEDE